MIRRALSLVLILQLLLTQLLHCRCDAGACGGGKGGGKPHLHASSLPFGRAACEDHDGGEGQHGHAHHHHGHEHDGASDPQGESPQGGEHEHDSDAVYLSDAALAARPAPRLSVEFFTSCVLASAAAVIDPAEKAREAIGRSPPPTTGYPPGRPLYLQNLTILI